MLELKKLNKQQQAAVKHDLGPLLVVAGAGTGKTQVITSRVAYLIEQKMAKPSEIVALTFTEKAAREMETRVSQLLGSYVLDSQITTFNAFGHELLRRYCYDAGFGPDLQLMTETQVLVFLREHLDELGLDYYAPVTNPASLLADLAGYFARLKEQLIKPDDYHTYALKLAKRAKDAAAKQEAACHQELANAYTKYVELARAANLIDFADQVYLAVELLEKRPQVAKQLQSQFKYWLVDEFQDTNLAQSRLVDLLSAKNYNVVVVGDDDQSIYKFRGAAITNILEFKERHPKAKQLALIQNYRSSQQILDSAYQLIQHNNPERLEAKYQLDKRLRAQFSHQPPQLQSFTTYEEEAEWIAADIKNRLKKGTSPDEIAVLLRKNAQAKILERYLASAGVEYLLIGQSEDLYRQPAVKLLLNWLRVVTDPRDSESLYHLLASELYDFDKQWLRSLAADARRQHTPLEDILRETDETKTHKFLDQIQQWREALPQVSVGQLAYKFLEESGYLKQLIRRAKDEPALDAAVAHLNQFFTSLLEYERIATETTAIGYLASLPALLGGGERLASEDLADLYGQKVRLLTAHKAKGLEFATVYLFDLTQDTFPARRRGDSLAVPAELLAEAAPATDAHLAEERRLMYVAMTRAKRNLILTCSFDHGGRQAKKPSIFIEEALGQQPQLDQLRSPLARTSQIELFKQPPPSVATGLPPTIAQGDQLVLTVAQIGDYLMCPAEFYLRHVLSPPQPPTFALEYGILLHSAVQLYNRTLQSGQKPRLADLEGYLRANWPKEGFESIKHKQRGLGQALRTIKAFYGREQKAKRVPLMSEQAFELSLPDQKLTVRGRFDAVFTDEAGAEIRDYKTGATNITTQQRANARAKDNLQLAIYALAWQQLKGQPPAIVALDFIDSGLVGSAVKTARQLETVQRKIEAVAAGVRAQDWRPGSSHLFCSHQEYGF